jgi:hypothetical protein
MQTWSSTTVLSRSWLAGQPKDNSAGVEEHGALIVSSRSGLTKRLRA